MEPELPFAAITVTPRLIAYSTAFCMEVDGCDPPRDMLITSAPLSVDQMIPWATSPALPAPLSSRTRTGMIRASGATPAIPMPLLALAAIVPATCVPCP